MRKYFSHLLSLVLWGSGTGLVLITLSGETLNKALIISAITFLFNLAAIVLGVEAEE
jgi:hypothetical protein